MMLKDYLVEKRMSPPQFAVKCGICVATVYRHLSGGGVQIESAVKIVEATDGEVTYKELIGYGK